MFKFSDLEFREHPFAYGMQATYKGWSVIKCIGSQGFVMGLYEVQDPKGNIHGNLTPEAVERLIAFKEFDIFNITDGDDKPWIDDAIPI